MKIEMHLVRRAAGSLALGALLAACSHGSDMPDPDEGTMENMPHVQGGISLHVDSSGLRDKIGPLTPTMGRDFLVVSHTLSNVSQAVPLPVIPTFFCVITDAQTKISAAAAASLSLQRPCPADTQVTKGGMFSCQVAFELPKGQTALRLLYTDPGISGMPRMIEANIPVPPPLPPPSACTTFEKKSLNLSSDCIKCAQPCGNDPVLTTCSMECNTCILKDACTSCPRNCTGNCLPAIEKMMTCFVNNCSQMCFGP